MKQLMKKFSKEIFAFIIGIIISGGVVYAGTTLYANQVTIDKSDGKLANISGSTIQDALDYFNLIISLYDNNVCSGCVYDIHTSVKFNVNSTGSMIEDGETIYKTDANSKLLPSEYTTDYKTLNSNTFLGHIIDDNGYILQSFVCGINNYGNFFCLRGVVTDQTNLTYKPIYQENANIINLAFPYCNATTSNSNITCSDLSTGKMNTEVRAYSYGGITIFGSTFNCSVLSNGATDCLDKNN